MPAKAGIQFLDLGPRFRGDERHRKASHETLHLLALAGAVPRARRDAAEGPPDGEGLARSPQGRSVRARLSEAQSRRRRADLDRRRRAAAGAVARDPRVSRREASRAADSAKGFARAGACARDRPDDGDGCESVYGAARAQVPRAGPRARRADAHEMDRPLGRPCERGGREDAGARRAHRQILRRRSGDGRGSVPCRASDQRQGAARPRPFRLSECRPHLCDLHGDGRVLIRAPAAPAGRAGSSLMRGALALAACFLILFVGGGARFAIGLTFRPMIDEFGWARGELGLAVGGYMLVSALATFIAGRLADRLSPRSLLIGGTVVGSVGIGGMSLVTQPWHALLLYGVVFAICNGIASLVIVGVIVMRIYPGRAGLANAVAISGMSVGQLLMIAVLAGLLAQIGWRSVFVWIGIAHLLLLPLLLALPGSSGAQSTGAALS